MKYSSVTSANVLDSAAEKIVLRLQSDANRTFHSRKIVFRPNYVVTDVNWMPTQHIWFAAVKNADHYWLPIGTTEPTDTKPLRILFEMNIPRRAHHGRAGIILADQSERLFLAHTGRIGGGVSGINRTNFLRYRQAQNRAVVLYDGDKQAILIGPVDADDLSQSLARFADEVSSFKQQAKTQNLTSIQANGTKPFQPKFTGTTRRKAQSESEVKLLHDKVCAVLNAEIPAPGGLYDKQRDLYTMNPDGSMSALYEIKTDCSTTSVYTAVGQLLIHSQVNGGADRLILVVPGKPNTMTSAALKKMNISILSYQWKGDKPVFPKG